VIDIGGRNENYLGFRRKGIDFIMILQMLRRTGTVFWKSCSYSPGH
jgi:hypothetical protein